MKVIRGKPKVPSSYSKPRKKKPATSPEAREKQLIAAAYDLVEQRIYDGTATSQETTHFLKLGTQKAKLEQEILEKQKLLIEAKTEELQSHKRLEELYTNALAAMRDYSGMADTDD